MNGSIHKVIGIVGGACLATYAVSTTKDPYLVLTAVTAPFGAMLPDVDHCNTRLGKQRIKIVARIRALMMLVAVCMVIYLAYYYFRYQTVLQLFVVYTLAFIGLLILPYLATIPAVQKRLNFYVKHRGIMHTLVPIAVIYLAALVAQHQLYGVLSTIFSALLYGLAYGYATHLFADMCNVAGCPILFPLSKSSISLLGFESGSAASNFVGGILCCLQIIVCYYLVVIIA